MRSPRKTSESRVQKGNKSNFSRQKYITSKQLESQPRKLSTYLDRGEENKANRWVNNLQERPLLELMNEKLEHNDFVPIKPTELNCYQRLKNVLSAQTNRKQIPQYSKSNSKILKNVVVFQAEINKLEQNFLQLQKNKSNHLLSKNNRSYIYSKSSNKHSSFFDKYSQNNTLNSSTDFYKKENSGLRHTTKNQRPKDDLIKKSIKEQMNQLKKQSFTKYMEHKKDITQKTFIELQQFIDTSLDKKIQELIDRKLCEYDKLREENSNFNRVLLEKNLHIQQLLKEIRLKEDKLLYESQKHEPIQDKFILKLSVQQFYDQYHSLFGNIPLDELKKKMDYMQNKCLHEFKVSESNHIQIICKLKSQRAFLLQKIKDIEQNFLCRQRQLDKIVSNRQRYDKLDNSYEKHQLMNKIPEYRVKISQLQRLQRYIMSKYIEWLDEKRNQESSIIQSLTNINSIQDYEQMIDSMVSFNRKFESKEKHMTFFGKILCSIAKIKRLITSQETQQKLEPLATLDDIQNFIKNILKNKKIVKKKTFNKYKHEIKGDNGEDFLINI